MRVERVTTAEQLAGLRDRWNALARGVPFRWWQWLHSWWEAFGAGELYVLAVYDGGRLAGLAPWYLLRSRMRGRVLQFLGDGELATDHLTVMSAPADEAGVAAAVADWLLGAVRGPWCDQWDVLSLDGVTEDDGAVAALTARLAEGGVIAHRRRGESRWRIDLPPTWAEYLMTLSQSHRKQLRRLDRTGEGVVVETVRDSSELARAVAELVELHQRRWQGSGHAGAFAGPNAPAFLRLVAERFMETGRLRLHRLTVDGVTVAAEFQVAGDGVTYAYQAGFDPDRADLGAGRHLTAATIKAAIAAGHGGFDLLRGDQWYKAHFRARPTPTFELRLVPRHPLARVRHLLWLTVKAVRRWASGRTPTDEINGNTLTAGRPA